MRVWGRARHGVCARDRFVVCAPTCTAAANVWWLPPSTPPASPGVSPWAHLTNNRINKQSLSTRVRGAWVLRFLQNMCGEIIDEVPVTAVSSSPTLTEPLPPHI